MSNLKTLMDAHKFRQLLAEKVDPIVCVTELVRCKNAQGKAFYAYLRIMPSEYMHYKMQIESGAAVNPNDYEILEYGWGEEPPVAVKRIMEERHGVDHELENRIRTMLEQTQHAKAEANS